MLIQKSFDTQSHDELIPAPDEGVMVTLGFTNDFSYHPTCWNFSLYHNAITH